MALNASTSALDPALLEAFSLRLHVNTILSLAANLLALYLIVFHSTRWIASYKWCLFDITLSFMLFDFHFTVVFQGLPVPGLYSQPTICTVGLARYLPPYYNTVLQLALSTELLGCCIGALSSAFLFRFLAVYRRQRLMKSPFVLVLLLLLHLVATLPSVLAFISVFRDDEDTRSLIRKAWPHRGPGYPCMLRKDSLLACYVLMGLATLWGINLFVMPWLIYRKLQKERCILSASTYRAQRALLVILPLITMVILIVALATCVLLNVAQGRMINRQTPNLVIVQLAIQVLTLHSLLNAIALIALTKPYRAVVVGWLKCVTSCLAHRNSDVTPTSVTISVPPLFLELPPSFESGPVRGSMARRKTMFF